MLTRRWIFAAPVITAGLQLAACSEEHQAAHEEPSHVEHIAGSDVSMVTLTELAAERLGIETADVEEVSASRTRRTGGQIVATPKEGPGAETNALWVRVPAIASDLEEVKAGEPAYILSLAVGGDQKQIAAEAVDHPLGERGVLYYAVDPREHNIRLGEPVTVELSVEGQGATQKVVPYSSLLYDADGRTWVYVSPEPLSYVREEVEVDYILGDRVFLTDGPEKGTPVVSVGAAEVFGTEFEVGH